MKKDLKSSKRSEQKSNPVRPSEAGSTEVPNSDPADFWQSMQGKSQQELQQTFYQTARNHIMQGTYDENAIMRMIDQLGPMITQQQKEHMLELLRSVRGN